MDSILKLDNLGFSYDNLKFVLKNINMEFKQGVCYGISGRSGAGKSTLLSLLAGLETSKYGHIYYKNQDLFKMNLDKYRCNEIGIIFQSYNLLPQLTAIENVVLSMDISNLKVSDRENKAKTLLRKVGIREEMFSRRVLQLSGGEQQRVAIARALSYDSEVILADEPTGNLDPDMEGEIINLLLDIAHKENKCVIIISHSRELMKKVDEAYVLSKGNIEKND